MPDTKDIQAVRDRIEASFARQNLLKTFEARLTRIDIGEVEIQAPILPIALQQHGYGHAGLSFTLGDTAAGYAAMTVMPVPPRRRSRAGIRDGLP